MRTTKHKYYDVIVAWAKGEAIQVNWADKIKSNPEWTDFDLDNPRFDSPDLDWRIKPKTKVIRYRNALIYDGISRQVALIYLDQHFLDLPAEYSITGFIKWLGDTQEVEVEV